VTEDDGVSVGVAEGDGVGELVADGEGVDVLETDDDFDCDFDSEIDGVDVGVELRDGWETTRSGSSSANITVPARLPPPRILPCFPRCLVGLQTQKEELQRHT
jgi:hypothetical protein